jgi:hypothetical protein
MKTIVDIACEQVKTPDHLSKKKKGYESAFALWKEKNLDGLSYQQKLRNEWNTEKK